MHNSKLIQVFKSFSNDEIVEYEKFIRSPLYRCKNFVINFYLELVKYYPEFNEEHVERKKIYSSLYKDKPFNDGLIRRMTSDLFRLAEEFLMHKRFDMTPAYRNQCLLEELRIRKLDNIFVPKSKNISNELLSKEYIDSSILLDTFFVEHEILKYRLIKRDKQFTVNLETSLNALLTYFIESLYSFINHLNYFNFEYQIKSDLIKGFLENFDYVKFIKSVEHIDNKYAYFLKLIYYNFSIISNQNDEENYRKLRNLLMENKYISPEMRVGCFYVLSAFCINQNMKTNSKYVNEAYELNEIILKEKLFLVHSEYLQLSFCRTHILLCKRLEKYDYISQFTKNYSNYIHPDNREYFITYCNALIAFSKKEFGKSLEYSSLVDIDWPVFKKDIKILKIKCYYELGYTESVYTEADAFKHFLSSASGITEDSIINGRNFVDYVLKLLKLKEKYDSAELMLLKKNVEHENNLNEKEWLIETITNY